MNDILLTPKISDVTSRDMVDTSVKFTFTELDIPIIASPMKGITSVELIKGISRLGGIGLIHRFYDNYVDRVHDCLKVSGHKFGVAIGINDTFYREALDFGASIICIDVANGYLTSLHKFCFEVAGYIIDHGYECDLMSGNVVTPEGAKALYNHGVDIVRVGIGTGSLCSTRDVTGVGYPYLVALQKCSETYCFTVADGGMKNSGDIVKSLAMGAKAVMIGSLFGKSFESSHNGIIYGMASRRLQEEYYHNTKSIEGTEREIEKTMHLKDIVDELVWGIKSACTYLNANKISDLRKAEYVIV